MTKFIMSWTRANGEKVENQLYTVDRVTHQLESLIAQGCTDIVVKSVEVREGK